MGNIQDRIDDTKCPETVRTMRRPEGVTCPHCSSDSVLKDGWEDTRPHRQRSECHAGRRRFDDRTGAIFADHRPPLQIWVTWLYLMGFKLSGSPIAKQRDLNKDDVRAMLPQLRQGIIDRRPPATPSGEVECDGVYVVSGHKGHPEAVKRKDAPGGGDARRGGVAGGRRPRGSRRSSGCCGVAARSSSGCGRMCRR